MVQGFVEGVNNGKKLKRIFHHVSFLLVIIWNQNDAALCLRVALKNKTVYLKVSFIDFWPEFRGPLCGPESAESVRT